MNFCQYVHLRKDIYKGNWGGVERFIKENQEAEYAKISFSGDTALHIAIFARRVNIVKELINRMPEEYLNKPDHQNYTFLGYCALIGNIEMAECIIRRSPDGLSIGNGPDEIIPVVVALNYCPEIKMVEYLYSVTPQQQLSPRNGFNGATFITRAIYAKAFDMALRLLQMYPDLAIKKDMYGETPVLALASIPSAYPSGSRLIGWKHEICNKTNQISKLSLPDHHYYKNLLLHMCEVLQGLTLEQVKDGLLEEATVRAVKIGAVEFVKAILSACPDLVHYQERISGRSLFMLAVLHRQSEVFSHLCEFSIKSLMLTAADSKMNYILHMAAMVESSARCNTVPGAAFHMQSEVRWFKELEQIVHTKTREYRNHEGMTPVELFREAHKDMKEKGEKWMKDTATSCTVVGALIVTIVFAAAFTVPGGYDQTGFPTFLNEKVFMIFMVSDALSLFSSSTSVLMFLGILTSRYAEEDFLKSLPRKMIIGLFTLFFSIATMMIAFSAGLLLMLQGHSWIFLPVICLASVPVTLFVLMQFPLLLQMSISTYDKLL